MVVLDDFVPAECARMLSSCRRPHRRRLALSTRSRRWRHDRCCRQLLDHLTAPGFSGEAPPHDKWERAVRWLMNGCRRIKQVPCLSLSDGIWRSLPVSDLARRGPPPPLQTADGPGLPVSWGLRDDAMATLLNGGDLPCLYEVRARRAPRRGRVGVDGLKELSELGVVLSLICSPRTTRPRPLPQLHSRLQKLYPDYTIVHQPAFSGEGDEEEVEHAEEPAGGMSARASGGCGGEVPGSSGRSADGSDGGHVAAADAPGSVCEAFVANAAVHGDTFLWHVDGDPSDIPDGPWYDQNTVGSCNWRAIPWLSAAEYALLRCSQDGSLRTVPEPGHGPPAVRERSPLPQREVRRRPATAESPG